MPATDTNSRQRTWWNSIFTDIHFWVPVVVLLGGLLLLRWIR